MSREVGPRPTVYKFGGTSIADAQRIEHVASLIKDGPGPLVVVVSALAGVTDELTRMCVTSAAAELEQLMSSVESRHLAVAAHLRVDDSVTGAVVIRLDELRRDVAGGVEQVVTRETDVGAESRADHDPDQALAARRDRILSAGEDLSALMVAAAVRASGRDARTIDARTVVRTDGIFGQAVPDAEATRRACAAHLFPLIEGGVVAVVQGFVAAAADGRTTTLGRGGSDFSAGILGGALDAEVVHIWTDVDGILSGAPTEVAAPRLLNEIGFEEAVEMSWAGARVLHPVAAKWAVAHGVPLRIRNTFRPEGAGTLIRSDVRRMSEFAAVSLKPDVALIKVRSHPASLPYGFLARVFGVLGRHRLEVDLVATSHSSTAFTIDEDHQLVEVAEELSAFADVDVTRRLATVTVVGHGLLSEPGLDARVFSVVGQTPVHLISQASDVSLSFVVDAEAGGDVVRRLHQSLIELAEEVARRSA